MNLIIKTFTICAFSVLAFTASAQGMNIKWEDSAGREFTITAPSGYFSYGMIPGDNIRYDMFDKVTQVGNVRIRYDMFNKVTQVGNVRIRYDMFDKVTRVGGLSIRYDMFDKITGTSGRVQ